MADIRITPAASVMAFTSSLAFKETFTQSASGSITLYGSGSTGRTNLFAVDGNNGRLFSIDDDLSNSLFSVNTIAGLPVIEAFADNTVNIGKYGAYSFVATGSGDARIGSGSVMFVSASGAILMNTSTIATVGGFTNTTLVIKQLADGLFGGGLQIEENGTTSLAYFGSDGNTFRIGTSYRTTGAYRPISFATSGTERLRITNEGNFGFGTTTPVNSAGYTTLTVNGSSGGQITWNTANSVVGAIYNSSTALNIYSSAGFPIRFEAGGTEKMRITETGNVGIGTTSPASILNTAGAGQGITHDDSTAGKGYIRFRNGGTQLAFFGIAGSWEGSSLQDAMIAAETGLNIRFYTNGSATTKMFISGSGDVGIGTTNPGFKTTISADITKDGDLTNGTAQLSLQGSTASTKKMLLGYDTNSNGFGFIKAGNYGVTWTSLSLQPDGGNVGIGITNPGAKLHVSNGDSSLALFGPNTTWGAYLYVGASPSVIGTGAAQVITTDGNLHLDSATAKNTYINYYSQTDTFINVLSGKVGVGTSAPQGKLSVDGGDIRFNYGNAAANYYIYFNHNNSYDGGVLWARNNSTLDWQMVNTSPNGDFWMYSYGTSTVAFTLQRSSSNVGIGTTSPGTRLDVRYDDGVTSGEHNVLASFSRSGTGPLVIGYRADGTSVSSALIRIGDSLPLTIGTTSANQAFTLLNSGNVGIGTTNPTYRLEAHNNATANAALLYSSTSETTVAIGSTSNSNNANVIWYTDSGTGQIFRGGTGFSAWAGALSLNIYNSNGPIGFHPGATANVLYLTTGGLVGIGITTPQAPLSFANSVGNKIDFYHSTVSTGDRYGIQVQSDQLIIHSGAGGLSTGGILLGKSTTSTFTEAMRITNGGNVGIGTTSPTYKFEVSDGTRTGIINPNATLDGIFIGIKQAKPLVFGTNDAERMRITSAGLVGIGTTNVTSTLTVRTAANSVVGISDNTGIPRIGGYLDNGTLDELQIDSKLLYISNDNNTTMAISGSKVLIGLTSTVLTNKLVVQGDIWCTGITGSIITPGSNTQVLYNNAGTWDGASGLVYSSGNVIINGTTAINPASNRGNLTINGTSAILNFGISNTESGYIFHNGTNLDISQVLAQPLRFLTTNTVRMCIDASGNVGIGVTNPSGKLHIYGADTIVTLTNTNASGYGEFQFYEGASLKVDMFVVGSSLSTYAGANSFIIYQNSNAPIAFYTNGNNERMRITGAGNVGIGTTNPSTKLDVVGTNIRTDKAFMSQGSNATWSGAACFMDYISASSYGRIGVYDYGEPTWQNLYVGGGGKVGIGTTTFTYKLNLLGDLYITGGSIGVGVAPNSTDGRIDASNDIVAYSTSDIRFKENIQRIPNALEKVNTLSGNTFTWKPDPELTKLHGFEGNDVGIIAQEIEAILPDIVTTRDSGYKAVKYEKLVPLLIEAIKELTDKVNKLENR